MQARGVRWSLAHNQFLLQEDLNSLAVQVQDRKNFCFCKFQGGTWRTAYGGQHLGLSSVHPSRAFLCIAVHLLELSWFTRTQVLERLLDGHSTCTDCLFYLSPSEALHSSNKSRSSVL